MIAGGGGVGWEGMGVKEMAKMVCWVCSRLLVTAAIKMRDHKQVKEMDGITM
jgi:hypothetical protein